MAFRRISTWRRRCCISSVALNAGRGVPSIVPAVVGLVVLAAAMPLSGQVTGLPQDWSHRHMIFSNPGTYQQAVQNGTLDRWTTITNSTRYKIQQSVRSGALASPAVSASSGVSASPTVSASSASSAASTSSAAGKGSVKKDWSAALSGVAASLTGTIATLTSSSSISGTTTLTVDGVTLSASAPTAETATIVVSSTLPANGGSASVTIGSDTYTFLDQSSITAPSGATSCNIRSYTHGGGDSSTTVATHLYDAITKTGSASSSTWECGTGYVANAAVTASNPTATVDLTAVTLGSTGFTFTETGSTNFTTFTSTAGTDGTNSSTTFAYWSGNAYLTPLQLATNIASAVNTNTTLQSVTGGVSAVTSSTNEVVFTANATGTGGNSYTVSVANFGAWSGTGSFSGGGSGTLARVQPNTYPAKYASFNSSGTETNSCTDFLVYPTGTAGGTTATSTIVAYTNLYSGCTSTGAIPSIYWSYNTGNGFAVSTSPVLSLDGTQVAFIQSNGTSAELVLLKWAANPAANVYAPGAITSVSSGTAYKTCTTPCFYAISLGVSSDDSYSAPYYYYDGDVIYVGDDSSTLHEFTGVFLGTPTAGATLSLNSSTVKLSSPVFDEPSGQVLVGDLSGHFYRANSTLTSFVNAGYNGAAIGDAIADAPLVDSSSQQVFVFTTSAFTGSPGDYDGDNVVYQFGTTFAPLGSSTSYPGTTYIGTGDLGAGYYLYAGTFDNLYYGSSNHTGYMYVVGNTGAATGAALFQVVISSGSLTGASNAVVSSLTPSATGAYPWPTPTSEFCNNGGSACVSPATVTYSTGCTVSSSSRTLTCTSGNFTSGDLGSVVSGTDIASGTTVSTVNSGTSITMSKDGSGSVSGSGIAYIGDTSSGTDYVFFSLNRAQVGSCTDTVGHGCVLSYNVSIPGAVAITGNGLPVTTPGTGTNTGCWATGGIVIDSSGTTVAGASQIYFVQLNGATAGTPGNGPGSSGCTNVTTATIIDGVQTTQSAP